MVYEWVLSISVEQNRCVAVGRELKVIFRGAIPVEHRFAIIPKPCNRTGRAVAAGM